MYLWPAISPGPVPLAYPPRDQRNREEPDCLSLPLPKNLIRQTGFLCSAVGALSSAEASLMLPWPCRPAVRRLGRGKKESAGMSPRVLPLPFPPPPPLWSLCGDESGRSVNQLNSSTSVRARTQINIRTLKQKITLIFLHIGNSNSSMLNLLNKMDQKKKELRK